jgi:hypothetical protein
MGSNRLDRIDKSIEQRERASKEAHARHNREMRLLDAMMRRFIAFTRKDDREQRERTRVINKLLTQLQRTQKRSSRKRPG